MASARLCMAILLTWRIQCMCISNCFLIIIFSIFESMKKIYFLLTAIALMLVCSTNSNAQKPGMVAVYRWYIPYDDQYITVTEDKYSKEQIKNWGWTDKTLLCY